jgi:TolB-like protein/DNA-binding winged helix-turn-helix (wHTH) protein/Tfp pilus assembly protein PilF
MSLRLVDALESMAGAVLRFGPFALDVKAGELRRDGISVRLQPQPFKVLALLASRAGEIVSREEIRRAVWGEDRHVEFDQGLGFCLSQIRAALGDSSHSPRYVQTLPRRGYRFLVPVHAEPPRAPVRTDAATRAASVARIGRAAVLSLLLLGLSVTIGPPTGGGAARDGLVRLVVLPFEDLSDQAGAVALGDALTEEMIAEIGRLNPQRLRVIARTSAMRYRDSPPDLERLRRELDVDYVLEGSVRLERQRVRITTRLVRIDDVAQVWVDSYDRELRDLLVLERQVAADAARQVGVALTSGAPLGAASARATDPELSHLTRVARHHAGLRTPEGLERAVALFRQVVERDPAHASAWAGLADAYLALGDRALLSPAQAFAEAEAAARRAIALEPALGAAHAALGGVAALRDWSWTVAQECYDRALALDPADVRVLRWYSHLMTTLGRREEALDYARRAIDVDPLSVLAHHDLTYALLLAGRYAEALEQVRRAEQLDLSRHSGHVERGEALLGLGRVEEALAALDDEATRGEASADRVFTRVRILKALGRREEAQAELRALLRSMDDPAYARVPQSPHCVAKSAFLEQARAFAALGERGRALDALERSVASREAGVRWLSAIDEFLALHDEPRFRALRRTLGIGA